MSEKLIMAHNSGRRSRSAIIWEAFKKRYNVWVERRLRWAMIEVRLARRVRTNVTCGWVQTSAPQARFFLGKHISLAFLQWSLQCSIGWGVFVGFKKFRIPLHKLCSLDYTIFQQLHNCVVKTRIWATTQLCSVDYTKKSMVGTVGAVWIFQRRREWPT